MKTIYKFHIPIKDTFTFNLPQGYSIVHVGTQKGQPFMWVLLDPHRPKVSVDFYLFGTGADIKDNKDLLFVGTFMIEKDSLVFHLFRGKV